MTPTRQQQHVRIAGQFDGQTEIKNAPLTNREVEVLRMIASGLSTKQLAYDLGITFKTAATHRASIMQKLRAHEVTALVRYAVRQGMIVIE